MEKDEAHLDSQLCQYKLHECILEGELINKDSECNNVSGCTITPTCRPDSVISNNFETHCVENKDGHNNDLPIDGAEKVSLGTSGHDTYISPSYVFQNVKMLTGSWKEFCTKSHLEKNLFLKGCKWSPDGTCLLTNSDDATMRLFDLPQQLYNCQSLPPLPCDELHPSLKTRIGGLVYDFGWYPLMSSMNPDTCCFATTSANSPVQLWDAFSGTLRCSYRGYNLQDELHAALSVSFNPLGDLLLCGYKDSVKVFYTDVPGRDYVTLSTKDLCSQTGLVSCIAVNPSMPNLFAAGTYTKTVGLYSVDGHGMCLLTGQSGGLTQLIFSFDGSLLFAAGRKDPEILCWDLRHLGQTLAIMKRPHSTNQRVYMDLTADQQFLLSGSTDGHVYVWDLSSASGTCQPLTHWQAHNDCVNGLSIHRHIPVVATASGQRCVPEVLEGNDDDYVFTTMRPREDSVKLWWTGNIQVPTEIDELKADTKRDAERLG